MLPKRFHDRLVAHVLQQHQVKRSPAPSTRSRLNVQLEWLVEEASDHFTHKHQEPYHFHETQRVRSTAKL